MDLQYCIFYRKLVLDEPGRHCYVTACRTCNREFGDEWQEDHWGVKEAPSQVAMAAVECPLRKWRKCA